MSKLSILTITYNQQDFIGEALDSFLNQKTNFEFEVLINDDCSTDNTKQIILDYAEKYPALIKPVFNESNIGVKNNYINNISRCKTEYAIMCEGDDYFGDPQKLQKQVDFLDNNKDVSICFHPVHICENGVIQDRIFPDKKKRFNKTSFTLSDVLKRNFIQTNSAMYRWRLYKDPLCTVPNNILPLDHFMHMIHAEVGTVEMLQDVMSVYRKHSKGIWHKAANSDGFYARNGLDLINFQKAVEERFKQRPEKNIMKLVANVMIAHILHGTHSSLAEVMAIYPEVSSKILERWRKSTSHRFSIFDYMR